MKTIFISLLLVTLCLGNHPLMARQTAPFTSIAPVLATPASTIIHFDASIKDKKVLLNWTIGQNQDAGMFELQKSTDGKTFTTAALVFGTDKTETDSYQFYEKMKSKKTSYRLKVIYKDQTVEFSDVVNIR